MTKKTDFGSEESFIFTTPSGLWVIINDCAYKLKNPKIDNFNFDYGRKTKTFNHQLSDVVETAHIDKLHQIFSSEDVKAVSKIMSRKFDSMGEE